MQICPSQSSKPNRYDNVVVSLASLWYRDQRDDRKRICDDKGKGENKLSLLVFGTVLHFQRKGPKHTRVRGKARGSFQSQQHKMYVENSLKPIICSLCVRLETLFPERPNWLAWPFCRYTFFEDFEYHIVVYEN